MAEDQLKAAWHAVSERLVSEGYSRSAVAETMLDVALRSSIDSLGCNAAGARVLATMRGISAEPRLAEAA